MKKEYKSIKKKVINKELDKITVEDIELVKRDTIKINKIKTILLIITAIISVMIFIIRVLLSMKFTELIDNILIWLFNINFYLMIFLLYFGIFGRREELKIYDRLISYKNNKTVFEPYTISKEMFLKEFETYGTLPLCFILFEGEIFYLEIYLDEKTKEFIGYINGNKIVGKDNIMNYKIKNNLSLSDKNEIMFIEYNSNAPKEYFVNKKI